jgi:ribosomal protein S18 acetylase RimI-like enzyme
LVLEVGSIKPRIRPFDERDTDAVVGLSLRAWALVFAPIERALGSEIYRRLYSDGWRVSQQQVVEAACTAQKIRVWVAEVDASTVGFIAVKLHPETSIGEIYLLAVDPDYQDSGIGTTLTEFALEAIREAGMMVAMV